MAWEHREARCGIFPCGYRANMRHVGRPKQEVEDGMAEALLKRMETDLMEMFSTSLIDGDDQLFCS